MIATFIHLLHCGWTHQLSSKALVKIAERSLGAACCAHLPYVIKHVNLHITECHLQLHVTVLQFWNFAIGKFFKTK